MDIDPETITVVPPKMVKVKCPNCKYIGDPKVIGHGGLWILLIILFLVSFLFWPLFLAVIVMFFWLLFKKDKWVCPKCDYKNPIPFKATAEEIAQMKHEEPA